MAESPLGEFSLFDFIGAGAGALSSGGSLQGLLNNVGLDRSWIFIGKPRDKSTTTEPVTLLDINLSSDGHRDRVLEITETQYKESLIQPFSFRAGLPEETYGHAVTSAGNVIIADPDTVLRAKLSEDWMGRDVDLYLGPHGGDPADFVLVAELLSRSISAGVSEVAIIVDDFGFVFDNNIQDNIYLGTGGLEGGSDLEGRVKPFLFGIRRQFEPVLVDGVRFIYQINDGSYDSHIDSRVNGALVSFNADVADIEVGAPPAGTFDTSLATGFVRFGTQPAGLVTVGARGHDSSVFGYVENVSDLVKMVAVVFGGLADPGQLDSPAFVQLAIDLPGAIGKYVDKPMTLRELINIFHRSFMTYSWLKPARELTIGRIELDETVEFTLDASKHEIRDANWNMTYWGIVLFRVIVGYRQTDVQINQIVVSASQDFNTKTKEYLFVEAPNSAVNAQISVARQLTVLTDIDDKTVAETFGDFVLGLFSVIRYRGAFSPAKGLLGAGIGDRFELIDDRQLEGPSRTWTILDVTNRAGSKGGQDDIMWVCLG